MMYGGLREIAQCIKPWQVYTYNEIEFGENMRNWVRCMYV